MGPMLMQLYAVNESSPTQAAANLRCACVARLLMEKWCALFIFFMTINPNNQCLEKESSPIESSAAKWSNEQNGQSISCGPFYLGYSDYFVPSRMYCRDR